MYTPFQEIDSTASPYVDISGDALVALVEGSSPVNEYDLNFQVELFAGGDMEFRYGTMDAGFASSPNCQPTPDCQGEANGSSATIGFQNMGTIAELIHFGGIAHDPGQQPMPGGLSNRSFRVEREMVDGFTKVFHASEVVRFCGEYQGYLECQEVYVEVSGP